MRSGFTLLELLIVIAIVAVLSVILIVVLNPLEQLAQGRDDTRLSDFATIKTALGIFHVNNNAGSMGTASTTYLSIPDPTATSTAGDQCQGLSLPSLPAGWTYHCAASSTYTNTDGTGWIPVNLASLTEGSPVAALPVDPTNVITSNLYYTYQARNGQYELTAAVESQKYQTKTTTDGGRYSDIYEYGTKLSLAPIDYGQSGSSLSLGGTGWVSVPGNATFGTSNFTVMKYSAVCSDGNGTYLNDFNSGDHTYSDTSKNCTSANGRTVASLPGGWPIANIAFTTARSYCQNIGAHLLTNDEYMTVVTNAANLGSNWSGGSPGSGYLYSGHNDANPNLALAADSNDANGYFGETNTGGSQKRTFTLSNGSVVWDFAGNVLQFVERSANSTSTMALPACSNSTGAFEWCEYAAPGSPTISAYSTDVTQARVAPPNAAWYSSQGMGQVWTYGTGANQGTTVFARGGAWDDAADAGAFSLYLSWNTSAVASYIGFRCAR